MFRNAEVDRSHICHHHSTCSSACPLPFIDRLSIVGRTCLLPVNAPACINVHIISIPFLSQSTATRDLTQIPECLHCTIIINACLNSFYLLKGGFIFPLFKIKKTSYYLYCKLHAFDRQFGHTHTCTHSLAHKTKIKELLISNSRVALFLRLLAHE